MEKSRNYYLLFIISAVIIYFLIYIPAYYIPIHSDDYSYFLKGLSLQSHMQHYMNWSGRFITDYTSSILLNLFSKKTYMAINSFAFLLVLINISLISSLAIGEKLINKNSYLILWVAFFIYWLCNPNLGQTSFWLVGSANYLWTLMWGSCFLIYLFYLLEYNKLSYVISKKIKYLFLLSVLGFFAGLSNEATGISIVFLTFIIFVIYRKKIVLIGLTSVLTGYLLLLLAPGNYIRLRHDMFFYWNNISILNKITIHTFERLPYELSGFWFAFLIINILFLFILLYPDKSRFNPSRFQFVVIFFLCSIFSVIVFVVSPGVPPRALNTFNFFIALTVATLLNIILCTEIKRKKYLMSLLLFMCIPYFLVSWSRFTYAMKQTSIQAKIRETIIHKAVNLKEKEVKIPDWYFTKLVKSSDKFDLFRSGAMPGYYGIKNIIWKPSNFNYAIIKNRRPLVSNKKLSIGLIVNLYHVDNWFFDEPSLIFEFNKNQLLLAAKNASHLFFHVYLYGEGKFVNADMRIKDFTEIGDKCYFVIKMKDKKIKSIKSIEKINFGIYDAKSKQRYSSDKIVF